MRQKTWLAALVTALFLAGCSQPVSSEPHAAAASPAPELPKITQFYAAPAHPHRGEKTLLCYGVENATAVRLDPPVDRVWPSISHCLEVSSEKAAAYNLTASGAGGSVSQTVELRPGPPAVQIIEVSINKLDFASGETAFVCYKAKDAKNVSVRPGHWLEPHAPENGCVADALQHTTTFVVTASGAGGDTDVERVTARVK